MARVPENYVLRKFVIIQCHLDRRYKLSFDENLSVVVKSMRLSPETRWILLKGLFGFCFIFPNTINMWIVMFGEH